MDDNVLQVVAAISKGGKSQNQAVPVTMLSFVDVARKNIQEVLRRHQ
jgi:hypothetical protein